MKVSFSPEAVAEVHRFTAGIPRLINAVCDNCLLLGFVRQEEQITPAIVKRGIEDMVPNFADDPWPAQSAAPQRNTGSLRLAGGM
ncbi:MAG: hypothetical protein HC898_00935 [Phycisphaerales bacterium]|nr:hypothetical protein [Phycisphaerales bacterium]